MKLIPLTQGKFAQVDDEDYDFLMQWKWQAVCVRGGWYVTRGFQKTTLRMHRVVLNVIDSRISVDHIDHNGLNNQKSNIRKCSQAQNCMNRSRGKNTTSKYMGVSFKKSHKKYVAYIHLPIPNSHKGRQVYLGIFESEVEAAKARDVASKKHHGEFANLNFK